MAVELLARMGIGQVVVVDYDCFSESNLNRQLLATETNLGNLRLKPLASASRGKWLC